MQVPFDLLNVNDHVYGGIYGFIPIILRIFGLGVHEIYGLADTFIPTL